tara:strand:+ start:241 stop:543 length:303 start_codon:yes stop_codon:yes gene_type:complete
MKMHKMKTHKNAFEILTLDPSKLCLLENRNEMMNAIIDTIKTNNWTQKEAAEHLGVSQPRISNLKNGELSKFSAMMLMNMLVKLDFTFQIEFTAPKVGIK